MSDRNSVFSGMFLHGNHSLTMRDKVGESIKVVAILAANPALSAVLRMVLTASPGLRVREFEGAAQLTAYMRLAPVDLVIGDYDSPTARADKLASELRQSQELVRPGFQTIALASDIEADTRRLSLESGIDEIIVKPMSPRYLLERVRSRLQDSRLPQPHATERVVLPPQAFGGNVIPLFGQHPRHTLH